MQDTGYRDSIIEAVRLLKEMENRLFTAMVNTGMCGVHQEIHQSFEPGDVFDFEISMFEDTGDANLEQLVGLLKKVAGCRSALKNLNGLEEDGLGRQGNGPGDLELLFRELPRQWGLRGDPLLWKALQRSVCREAIPSSAEAFLCLLHLHFTRLMGSEPRRDKTYYSERLASGGMSSGRVDGNFWLDTGFPLLVERFKNLYVNG